ncbi:MAG: TIGR03087 family PEP-CTERM/XrtA system glycosyltransferase [Gammaproteobacteria bacterium]
MSSVLFICHRLPWPPTKGDKIRSYHVLRRLAEHYNVYLGAFVDDAADWQYVSAVKALCADTCIRPLTRSRMRLRALGSLARGEALTVGVYRDRVMRRWVERVIAERKLDLALGYSSGIAPFLMRHSQVRRVMDFVDVDSDKWRQYAEMRHGWAGVIYRREARRLAPFERAIAAEFDASLLVSEAEARLFRSRAPESASKVQGISNGVDAEYWDPGRVYPNPYQTGERAIVLAGAMDYRANVHAAQWFAREIWPRTYVGQQAARFYIVGSNPTAAVRALGRLPGIVVTGRVKDVRPYIAHAHAVATPLRIARGIQNKVLEALAMEKVLLATPEAFEGIEDFKGRVGCISASPEVMTAEALRALNLPQPVRVPAARTQVLSRYAWTRALDAYENVLRNAPLGVAAARTASVVGLEACS